MGTTLAAFMTTVLILILYIQTFECKDDAVMAFPGVQGSNIGQHLPPTSDFQPSDLVWHERLQSIFVVGDNGYVSRISDGDGEEGEGSGATRTYTIEKEGFRMDLESITVANISSNFLYLGIEFPATVLEWNFEENSVTRAFDLSPFMNCKKTNKCMESLTFVPDLDNPEGGVFYVGKQDNSHVYVLQLSIASSATNTSVEFVEKISENEENDLSAMYYYRESLYSLYGNPELMVVKSLNGGEKSTTYHVTGYEQEGIAIKGCGDETILFVAYDGGNCVKAKFRDGIAGIGVSMAVVATLIHLAAYFYVRGKKVEYNQYVKLCSKLVTLNQLKVIAAASCVIWAAILIGGVGVAVGIGCGRHCGQVWRYKWPGGVSC